MLIVSMPQLSACLARHRRNEHVIVIDQLDGIILNQNVAMLQVAVSNTKALQVLHHLDELIDYSIDLYAIAPILSNKQIKPDAVDPFHLNDGEPVLINSNTFENVFEVDHMRNMSGHSELRQLSVAHVLVI